MPQKLFMLAGLLSLSLTCAKTESTVTIRLTSPEARPVGFDGYYKVESTGDSLPLSGSTPAEYDATVRADNDRVDGVVGKTSQTDTDTLRLEILVDGRTRVTGATAHWYLTMPFTVHVGPH